MPQGRYSRKGERSINGGMIAFIVLLALFIVTITGLTFLWNWDIVIDTSDMPSEVAYGETVPTPKSHVYGKLFYKNGFEIETTTFDELDTSVVGHQEIYYQAEWAFFKRTIYEDLYVYDRVPPEINLTTESATVNYNEEYVEEGYSAYDEYDGDITDKVKRIESDNSIIYFVADSSGNYVFAERKIIREDPPQDTTAPTIALNGSQRIVIEVGDEYVDPGAIAIDDFDGNITHNIVTHNNIKSDKVGSYVVDYVVADNKGNTGTARRVVDVVENYKNKGNGKAIYLTFDDGPSPYTKDLLKILKKYNIQATFFVMGDSDYTSVYKDIVDGGHSIGIHGINHTYSKLYASDDYFIDNLSKMQKKIEDKTGVKTYLIRFPGGSSNTVSKNYNKGIMTRLSKKVEELGYVYFDWNVDSDDAGKAKDSKTVFKNVTEGITRNGGLSVVLQHDVKDFSVEAVEDIIIWGISNGYVFKALDTDSPTAHHPINN